jgi:hypothetical protein
MNPNAASSQRRVWQMERYGCYCARWCAPYMHLSPSVSCAPKTHAYVPEKPSQFPVVPPRIYPAPPPSRLPGLLVGTFKVLSWLAGGSTALLFIYYVRARTPSHLFYHRSDRANLGQLAIPASAPYAVGTRPSLAQGTPKRPCR